MGYLRKNRKTKKKWPITILFDDREKKPWKNISPQIFNMKRKRLHVGDYTIEGYENIVAIEKKNGLAELIQNISGHDRKRFKKCLNNLSKFTIKFIVIEDSLDNLNERLKELPKYCKIDKASVLYWISAILVIYKIPVIFVGKKKGIKNLMIENLFLRIMDEL